MLASAAVAAGGCASTTAAARPFDRVVVVVFENKGPDAVFGHAPEFDRLAHRYALMPRFGAEGHPSLPNYLALVSGSVHGIHNDCNDCTVGGRSLVDTLEAAHRSWKTYAEDLPSPGFTGEHSGAYTKHHNPFVYFRDVRSSPRRLSHIVPFTQMGRDLSLGSLPDFSLVVPNNCNNMHDCSVATGDSWLRRFLVPVLASPQMRRGVVFVIFDEGEGGQGGFAGGLVPALAVGPTVRRGARDRHLLSHYSLLRTIEDAFGLPRLGHSASARPIRGIWR